MAKLSIVPGDKTIVVSQGQSLLAVINGLGIELRSDCGGNATCGTCHVLVQEGRRGVSKVGREENERLDSVEGVSFRSRLACQAKVLGTENIKVELPGLASGL